MFLGCSFSYRKPISECTYDCENSSFAFSKAACSQLENKLPCKHFSSRAILPAFLNLASNAPMVCKIVTIRFLKFVVRKFAIRSLRLRGQNFLLVKDPHSTRCILLG